MLSTDNRLNWQRSPFERLQLWPRWIWNSHLFHPSRHVWWKNEQDARAIQCWPGSVEEKHPRRLAKRKTTSLTPCHSLTDEFAVSDGHFIFFSWWKEPESLRSEVKIDIHCGHQGVASCLRRTKNLRSRSKPVKHAWNLSRPKKESLISHDYSRKTLAEDRGWYFHLQHYCTHLPTALQGTTSSRPDSH